MNSSTAEAVSRILCSGQQAKKTSAVLDAGRKEITDMETTISGDWTSDRAGGALLSSTLIELLKVRGAQLHSLGYLLSRQQRSEQTSAASDRLSAM